MLNKTDTYKVKKFLNNAFKKIFFDRFAKYYSLDINLQIQLKALESTADYVAEHMTRAESFTNNLSLLKWAISKANLDGLVMEFGVWQGGTVNFIAQQVSKDKEIHGFDSFEGLPEFWVEITHVGRYDKGAFDMKGQLPAVAKNVNLHPGWFNESLPKFLEKHDEHVSFIHIDCDLYSSTKTVFDLLSERIKSGTIIVFDEYFNYPTWEKHEFKAFQEFVTKNNINYQYIGYNRVGREVAVIIL
jgi:Macrocin-O-methyltransferase (TylF)